MTTDALSPPLRLPALSPAPAESAPQWNSWNLVLQAYREAWNALGQVDDHHIAFLAMHLVSNAVDSYRQHLRTRPPKLGDLTNLVQLQKRLEATFTKHDAFMDEEHVDYASLRKETLLALQSLREQATRKCAMHALSLACPDFPPMSYSSSIDDMQSIQDALHLVEAYYALNPLFAQSIDLRPLAQTMRAIAQKESEGFADYKDEKFEELFEELTVRIARLHLDHGIKTRASNT